MFLSPLQELCHASKCCNNCRYNRQCLKVLQCRLCGKQYNVGRTEVVLAWKVQYTKYKKQRKVKMTDQKINKIVELFTKNHCSVSIISKKVGLKQSLVREVLKNAGVWPQ